MCDAARAADFQLPSGRLRDFSACTRWTGVRTDEDQLRLYAQGKASEELLAMNTICPQEADEMLKDGNAYVERATEAYMAQTLGDLKGLVKCKRKILGCDDLTLRFVKCQDTAPRAKYNDISSTTLRQIMYKKRGVKLREALDWMALSADLLWRCRSSWIEKARLGTGCCIIFQDSNKELQLLEGPRTYEEPPHFDDPPSLEELGLTEVLEESPAIEQLPSSEATPPQKLSPPIEEPPSLESPTSQGKSPTVEEPQSPQKPPPINTKKRSFSVAGFEEDVKIVGDPADDVFLADNVEIKKPGSCRF